jgi:hypothetical protein
MKMRQIKLDKEVFLRILQGKNESVISNFPTDAELIKIDYDLFSGKILIIIRSSTFEDSKGSVCIPEFNAKYNQIEKRKHIGLDTSKNKVETKIDQKEALNKDIIAYKKEFSPEQLELLRFSIEGEYLIVKPATYLKKEWSEINEVAKSIGGEWIKGSIISYWKIPLQ